MSGTSFTSDFDRLIVSWLVGHTVDDVERELIVATLACHHGCRTRAARDLNISIRGLRNKINEYKEQGVPVPRALDSVAGADGPRKPEWNTSGHWLSTLTSP